MADLLTAKRRWEESENRRERDDANRRVARYARDRIWEMLGVQQNIGMNWETGEVFWAAIGENKRAAEILGELVTAFWMN